MGLCCNSNITKCGVQNGKINSNGYYAGGAVGQVQGIFWMEEVYTTSNVTIAISKSNSGGLLGYVYIGAIAYVVNSYSNAMLLVTGCGGGIFGLSCSSSVNISFSENNFMLQFFILKFNFTFLNERL